jgi:hypothetical protein
MNFSFKRILLSFTAVVLLISSVIGGIHPFINQQKNHQHLNASLTSVKKDSSLVKKTTKTAKPQEAKKEKTPSSYFKDFINFDANEKEEQEENNTSFSLFPLLKEGLKVILNQITK